MITEYEPFNFFLWLLVTFLCGAIPFSVIIGKLALGRDIRQYGDANPGATNVLRAGGKFWALLALLLDLLKGAIPVSFAHLWLGLQGGSLILIALMPVLGHAFSPFLRFRGGKALAVTCGIWCGLTLWEGPTIGGLLLALFSLVLTVEGWVVIFGMLGMLGYFALTPPEWNGFMVRPDFVPTLLAIWLGNFGILIWKHHMDLLKWPQWGPGITKFLN